MYDGYSWSSFNLNTNSTSTLCVTLDKSLKISELEFLQMEKKKTEGSQIKSDIYDKFVCDISCCPEG
jgi:hypothetical protein